MAIARYKDLCLGASDQARLGVFWAGALGLTWQVRDSGEGLLTGPTKRHAIWVTNVPEPKTVKNRVHWDVTVPAVAPLVEAGAVVIREPDGDIDWHVLADPEGNEFCAFTE